MDNQIEELIEQITRKEYDPLDRAQAVKSYLQATGLSKTAAAARLNVPRMTLTDWLGVLEIGEKYQLALRDNFNGGKSCLSLSHVNIARGLAARVKHPELKNQLLEAVLHHELERDETRRIANMVRDEGVTIGEAVGRVKGLRCGSELLGELEEIRVRLRRAAVKIKAAESSRKDANIKKALVRIKETVVDSLVDCGDKPGGICRG